MSAPFRKPWRDAGRFEVRALRGNETDETHDSAVRFDGVLDRGVGRGAQGRKRRSAPGARRGARQEGRGRHGPQRGGQRGQARTFTLEETVVAEWNFLKEAAQDQSDAVTGAVIEGLEAFIDQHPDAPPIAEAEDLLASLYRRRQDRPEAMLALLKLLYEHPASDNALRAKSDFLELGGKWLSRGKRPALESSSRCPRIRTSPRGFS